MIVEPIMIQLATKCHKVVAGSFHSYAIAEEGVWAWGKNQHSTTCPHYPQSAIYEPVLIKIIVDNIATCSNHSFGWKGNDVYCWGSNINYELGMEDERQYEVTQMKVYKEAIETGLSIISFSCGESHSLAAFRQNENITKLFAWGESKSYQLSLDTTNVVPYPVLSEFEKEIKHIYSRSDYNIAICEDGVFSWGKNIFGRLGLNKSVNVERVPTLISIPQKIIKVAIGVYHSVAISEQGTAYSWGHAFEGQLGIGKILSIESTPKKMICEHAIVDAACGELHTVVVLKDGRVMSCGSNKHFGLGHNNNDDMKRSTILDYVQGLSKVVGVSCGNRHNLVINSQGDVYGWGSNKFGQVGYLPKPNKSDIVKDKAQKLFGRDKKIDKLQKIKRWKIKYSEFSVRKQEQEKKLIEQLQMIMNE